MRLRKITNMSNINRIRTKLKELNAPKPWFWDQAEDQWVLHLYNDWDVEDVEGYIAIRKKEVKWGVVVIGLKEWSTKSHMDSDFNLYYDELILLSETLQEAKRKVDLLLGSDSGEIPPFENPQ